MLDMSDRLIVFGNPVRHSRAAIGRCDTAPLHRVPSTDQMSTEPASTSPAPTSCNELSQVTLEDR